MFMVTGEICNKIQESVDANEFKTTKDKNKTELYGIFSRFSGCNVYWRSFICNHN